MEADKDGDGKLSFEEFAQMVANTVRGCCYRPRSPREKLIAIDRIS